VPSNKRQKELARRRAERQAARKAAERARRRKRRTVLGLTVGGVAIGVVLLLVLISSLRGDDKKKDTDATGGVACDGAKPPAAAKQTFTKADDVLDPKKSYTVSMKTSCGVINWELFADKAPQTANSLAFLAGKKFYDGTFCHRMTATATLAVLQCGDPEGTGGGGPGYTLAEENLKGAKYTRGTVAMAKTSAPHSTGSQFFLVDKDSELPPQYTVIGTMDEASLAVLDKIAAIGIQGGADDGPPNKRVYLETFTVTPK
jgi:peptidyl-prolyl cis-trans isomerase B (cyclophilin B)